MASSSSAHYGTSVPDANHRRKWDVAEYEQKARERQSTLKDEKDGPKPPPRKREKREYDEDGKLLPMREMLKPREFKVDLESKVGKSVVINKTTPSNETGGFYCDMCDCILKDSINFLDHINGRKHQKNMGMSMKVKKCNVDDVRARLALKKSELDKDKKTSTYDFEERVRDIQEEEQKMAEYRRDKRTRNKQRRRGDDVPEAHAHKMDPAFASVMGFGGFGGMNP